MPQKQQQVVVGIDGSEPAVRALRWALGYAEQTGARIEAVHAWQIPAMYGTAVAAVPSGEFRSAAERVLRETVDEALGEHGGLDVERVTEMGHPSKVLVEHSEGADLLVVG
ncbi:universal stress protein, partial [Glycomyces tenuis]